MAGTSQTALIGTLLAAMIASSAAAAAQSVPLPTPAPHNRTGSVPATTTAKPQRPPAPAVAAPQTQRAPSAPGSIPSLLGFSGPGGTVAFDTNQRALVDKISRYLSSVQVLSGNFVQIGPDGSRAQGQFYIQKPGKVRFEYDPPSPIDIIADGQSVVVRDRKLATQQLYPLSQTPLRFLLSDRIDLLRDTNLIGVFADDVFVTAVIEEKQPLVGTNRLMMMFSAKDFELRQWTVTDAQGYDTTVAVSNLDSTRRPDPSLFKIDYTQYPN
jgi:outer membrane lipoprotein-sorting protein